MVKASIDIGSNSILLLAIDTDSGKCLANESNITSLGKDLDKNKSFIQESMDESFRVLSLYVKKCNDLGIDSSNIVATATEASRVAKNSSEFYEKVYNQLGLNVHIISGEAEAYYSTIGILSDKNLLNEDQITVMDIGGASTELIRVDVKNKKVIDSYSFPIGAVRCTQWIQEGILKEKLHEISELLNPMKSKFECEKLYCVAGTMTSLGNMALNNTTFVEDEVHGLELSKDDLLNKVVTPYTEFTPSQYLEKFPFLGKRSNTIKGGVEVGLYFLENIGVKDVYISTYGLRYGTLDQGAIDSKFIIKQFS